MAWIIENDQLTNTDFIPLPDKPFHGNSPATFWKISEDKNNGMPYIPLMVGLPTLEHTGAFMNATALTYAQIPRSCKYIGHYAFTNTALKQVKIAADCTYFDTSFPADCEVTFYGGGGEWGQLLDGDGYAVIDGDGARVYIEEEI